MMPSVDGPELLPLISVHEEHSALLTPMLQNVGLIAELSLRQVTQCSTMLLANSSMCMLNTQHVFKLVLHSTCRELRLLCILSRTA